MAVELATAYISLVPSARGMTGKLRQELGGAGMDGGDAAAKGFSSRFQSGSSGAMSKVAGGLKVGFAAAFGGAAAVGGLAYLGNELLGIGAQVETFRQKSDTVFEANSASVKKWADKNNEAFGVTDDELTGMAASFGDLLKPMGFTADQAATMSTDVIGLAGALSSWTGGQKSAAEVSDTLAKAMLGEREELKGLGISITEADVSARLAAKGQDKLTGAALQQASALATQELIFEKSTDAQKAWANGGNEALNAQNRLKAQVGELKESVATALTPALTAAAGWLGDNLPKAVAVLKSGFEAVQPTLQTVAAWLREKIPPAIEVLRAGFAVAVAWVQANWPKISAAISSAATTIRSVIDAVITVVTAAWRTFGDDILRYVRSAWGPIQLVIKGAMNVIQGVIKVVTSLIKGDWGAAWEGIKQIFRGVWQVIQGIVRNALNYIKLVITVAFQIIRGVVQRAWDGIKALISGALNAIRSAVSAGFNAIKANISTALNAAKSVVSSIWNGIKSVISGAISGIRSVVSSGFSALKGLLTNPIEQAKSTISGILDGIKGLFSGLPGGISRALSGLAEAAAAPFRAVGASIKSAWNNTIGGRGITVPSLDLGPLGKIGGQSWTVPRLHSGGLVTGPAGSEQLRILEAGEWVLSRAQVAAMTSGSGPAASPAGGRAGVTFTGPVYLSDEVDVEMLTRKMGFAAMAGAL
jgi:hypothetical protein